MLIHDFSISNKKYIVPKFHNGVFPIYRSKALTWYLSIIVPKDYP